MEKMKEALNRESAVNFARAFSRAYPAFPRARFVETATAGLAQKELKERVKHFASALRQCLPADFSASLGILLRTLRSEKNPEGLSGFLAWPLTQFVEDYGLSSPALSLDALKEITKVMSAEFAIRAFLLRHEESTLRVLKRWVKDESEHVRRLVSEGTRPRLPWAQRLPRFQRDPQLALNFLRELALDPSPYVRKSVANHLNDFSKDHADWLVEELKAWKEKHPDNPHVKWILRHASRTLLKQGHRGALSAQGYGKPRPKKVAWKLDRRVVSMGEALKISLRATAGGKERWMIDYAIHHRKKDGRLTRKVFKWTTREMQAGGILTLEKRHAFRPISTRVYYEGKHEVEIFLNGQSLGKRPFYLRVS